MKPNKNYLIFDPGFWANIRLLNQRLGYIERRSETTKFKIPKKSEIIELFKKENLNHEKIIFNNNWTPFGKKLINYLRYRDKVLNDVVKTNLMDIHTAKEIFYKLKNESNVNCPLPLNKQKGKKKDFAFFTGIINMTIARIINDTDCNYNPMELTAITKDKFPVRTLSRRVDGAFPKIIDPIAIWEIKEYYNTTTFGSRVADGVYESYLDGLELKETNENENIKVFHYLMIDDYNTWWNMGEILFMQNNRYAAFRLNRRSTFW